MLNRTAEALFWIGRYMERAENHARLIDVYYHLQQDEFNHSDAFDAKQHSDKWKRIVDALGSKASFEHEYGDYSEHTVLLYVTLDRENPNSLVSCVSHARNNLRTLRELAPTELWEVLNSFYLWLKDQNGEAMLMDSPHKFFSQIKTWCNMFYGSAHSVMPRHNEWSFMECGRYLERAENTLRILHTVQPALKLTSIQSYPYLQGVLKSLSGYQTYRRLYADTLSVERILEFVVLNPIFPRSVHFAFHQLVERIRSFDLSEKQLKLAHERIVRQISKLTAELDCIEVSELTCETKDELTKRLLDSCSWIGEEFGKTFFLDGVVSA
ncbi:alpha-E domain-containing protein [Paenibacillus septentrionalis]|uniref:Alpha-E domain-containing protein n=1 Tax=Paenibacillus septentrionalis TaxID=429342 RepID=A0ABW1V7Z8_9BACL